MIGEYWNCSERIFLMMNFVRFRITKTEYWEKYLMKRFGGFEFVPKNKFDRLNLLNETLLTQFRTLLTRSNLSSGSFDPMKIVPLFEIHALQASVITPYSSSSSFLCIPFFSRFGTITKVGHRVLPFSMSLTMLYSVVYY